VQVKHQGSAGEGAWARFLDNELAGNGCNFVDDLIRLRPEPSRQVFQRVASRFPPALPGAGEPFEVSRVDYRDAGLTGYREKLCGAINCLATCLAATDRPRLDRLEDWFPLRSENAVVVVDDHQCGA